MKVIKSLLILMMAIMPFLSQAQTTLTAGDIAIIAYNNDDADQIQFVPLVALVSGTTIYFTDNGWNGSSLASTEGTYTYTTSSAVSAGTVVSITPTGMALSTSGDQIFVYQGSSSSPTFICGLSTTTPITTGCIASTTTYKPSSLTSGTNFISFSVERDNGYYSTASNSGSKSTICSNVYNSSNWTTNDTRITSFPSWSFSISGGGNEPTANPTSLTSSNVKSWKFDVSFTAASGSPAGYIVLRSTGSAPNTDPTDASAYLQGDAIGNAKVCYVGTGTSFSQKSLRANTTYYYKAYSYNGSGSSINYKQTSPLSGSITSGSNGMGSYYSGLNTSSTSFLSSLQTKVRSNYTKITYTNFTTTNVPELCVKDTSNGQKAVECVYSGYDHVYTGSFAWGTMSREHTWCHSWMPTHSSTSGNEYSDQHHLFPTQQNNANGVRSNHPLGIVTSSNPTTFGQAIYGNNANGEPTYTPRNEQKGAAARALLYMALRYNGVSGYNWSFNYLNGTTLPALSEDTQSVQLLLQWHATYPPSNAEIARNDYIYSIQGNRNPFIDHPEYVNYINFYNMTYKAGPEPLMTAVEEDKISNFDISAYPNPIGSQLQVNIEAVKDVANQVVIYNTQGKLMYNDYKAFHTGHNNFIIQTSDWTSGVYILKFEDKSLILVK